MEGLFWNAIWYPWAVPYETALLSSIQNKELTSIIYLTDDKKKIDKYTQGNLQYITPFNKDINKFPKHYFNVDRRKFVTTENVLGDT